MKTMYVIALVLLACATVFSDASVPTLARGEDGIQLLRDIAKKMDSAVPPPNKPLDVSIGTYINSFYEISEQSMDFGVSWYMRMAWQDERLVFSPLGDVSSIKAPDGFWDDIWTPDVFTRNEKGANAQSILTPQRLLKVNSTGHVWYVVKMSATLACQMDLHRFPMDQQICPIMFESFGYTTDVIRFRWLDTPIEVDSSVEIPTFTLLDTELNDCTQNYTAGEFPCLEAQFVLDRDMGYYIMQVYIPSIVLVIISWLQFYLRTDKVTSRALIGLFSTFTLVSQLTGIRASMPKISYMTAMDIWLTACLLFVFVTLLELALVQVISNRKAARELSDIPPTSKIDVASRVLFPLLFVIFMIIYWGYFGNASMIIQ